MSIDTQLGLGSGELFEMSVNESGIEQTLIPRKHLLQSEFKRV